MLWTLAACVAILRGGGDTGVCEINVTPERVQKGLDSGAFEHVEGVSKWRQAVILRFETLMFDYMNLKCMRIDRILRGERPRTRGSKDLTYDLMRCKNR